MAIFEPNKDFDFSQVYLDTPQPIQGGTFFTKLLTRDGNPLYMQMPVSSTKQGIVTTKKNKYCDLLYDKENQESLIGWILALEEHCQKTIFDKSELWFHNDFTKDDIETLMTPVYRLHNSGKKLLVRTYIDVGRENRKHKCVVYDEREVQTNIARIMAHTSIIPLVLIEGVKFSSKSFDIVIKLTQIMVLDDEVEETNNCLIRRASSNVNAPTAVLEAPLEEAPLEEAPIAEAPAEEAPAEEAPLMDAPIEEAPLMEAPIEEAPIEEAPIEEAPIEEAPVMEAPVMEAPVMEAPIEEAPVMEAPLVEAPLVEAPVSDVSSTLVSAGDNASLSNEETLEDSKQSELVDIDLPIPEGEPMNLRKPNEIYYEIYQAAKDKAIKMRRAAVEAYLETKEIKSKYMLEDIEDSDEDSDEGSHEGSDEGSDEGYPENSIGSDVEHP